MDQLKNVSKCYINLKLCTSITKVLLVGCWKTCISVLSSMWPPICSIQHLGLVNPSLELMLNNLLNWDLLSTALLVKSMGWSGDLVNSVSKHPWRMAALLASTKRLSNRSRLRPRQETDSIWTLSEEDRLFRDTWFKFSGFIFWPFSVIKKQLQSQKFCSTFSWTPAVRNTKS